MLGDECFGMVYHDELFAWYAHRARDLYIRKEPCTYGKRNAAAMYEKRPVYAAIYEKRSICICCHL